MHCTHCLQQLHTVAAAAHLCMDVLKMHSGGQGWGATRGGVVVVRGRVTVIVVDAELNTKSRTEYKRNALSDSTESAALLDTSK